MNLIAYLNQLREGWYQNGHEKLITFVMQAKQFVLN